MTHLILYSFKLAVSWKWGWILFHKVKWRKLLLEKRLHAS